MSRIPKNFFVNWYKEHGRIFPWREGGVSPFAMLVTEMLLRQTGANAVAKLWENFTSKYVNAFILAYANKEELRDEIKILGLSEQRSQALISAAQWLVDHYQGKVPSDLVELLKVPHVGLYAANAVLCFGFGEKITLVDTNILRLYSRIYGLEIKYDNRRNPEIWELAAQDLPINPEWSRDHNFGMLDFTAGVCKARKPFCERCPLVISCIFGQQKMQEITKG